MMEKKLQQTFRGPPEAGVAFPPQAHTGFYIVATSYSYKEPGNHRDTSYEVFKPLNLGSNPLPSDFK